MTKQLRASMATLADLAWPVSCAGCGQWGSTLCSVCSGAMVPMALRASPVWLPDLDVISATRFAGPVREVITAFKDEGRADLTSPLSSLLRFSVAHAIELAPASGRLVAREWRYVVMPSSAASLRTRGRYPLGELGRAIEGPRLRAGPSLALRRRVRDQSGLSRRQRRENLHGAYEVRPLPSSAELTHTGLVLIDDVVTTGATLAAARDALAWWRPAAIVAATIAVTGTAEPVLSSRLAA